jgi:Rrf2 family protein
MQQSASGKLRILPYVGRKIRRSEQWLTLRPRDCYLRKEEVAVTTMLTNKGKYGLKALVHLAGLGDGETAQSQEIAEANNIPKKFLDAILGELRVAGIVRSKKGKGGGYMLAQDPAKIMVGSAIRVLDGPLAPIACASRTLYQPCTDCGDVHSCSVRLMMLEVRDVMARILDNTSVEEMRRNALHGQSAPMYHI